MTNNDLEAMAEALETSGHYRVLRRVARPAKKDTRPDAVRRGLFLDLETTGLDATSDEVIEIALVPFMFDDDGCIIEVGTPFSRLCQPVGSIPASITALTGITNEMVAGKTIDPDEIAKVVTPAELIIAHNSRFDRPFAERLHPLFIEKPWACSMTQALWDAHGFEGVKLAYLLMSAGLYHDGHRALDDCQAAIALLSRPLGETGRTALAHVLDASARTTIRIWAIGAPFAKKDVLRARFYRWNAGDDGRPRAWFRDLDESEVDDEIAYLRAEVIGPDWIATMTRITALDRFSHRI